MRLIARIGGLIGHPTVQERVDQDSPRIRASDEREALLKSECARARQGKERGLISEGSLSEKKGGVIWSTLEHIQREITQGGGAGGGKTFDTWACAPRVLTECFLEKTTGAISPIIRGLDWNRRRIGGGGFPKKKPEKRESKDAKVTLTAQVGGGSGGVYSNNNRLIRYQKLRRFCRLAVRNGGKRSEKGDLLCTFEGGTKTPTTQKTLNRRFKPYTMQEKRSGIVVFHSKNVKGICPPRHHSAFPNPVYLF